MTNIIIELTVLSILIDKTRYILVTFNQMVEYTSDLDYIFGSLADGTRRDILRRLAVFEMTVSEIAAEYEMSLAAVSRHIKVLEQAGLVRGQKRGKQRIIKIAPMGLTPAEQFLDSFYAPWKERFNSIEQ